MGLVNQRGEDAMQPEELYDDGLDFDDEEAFEAEDWDEETLGFGTERLAGIEPASAEDLATAGSIERALEPQLGVERGRASVVDREPARHAVLARQ